MLDIGADFPLGPTTQPYFEKTWVLPDIELVN